MKSRQVLLAVAVMALLAAAVLVVWTTFTAPPVAGKPSVARVGANSSEVEALRDEVAALRRRLLEAEARPEPLPSAPREPAGGYLPREEFEAFRSELFTRLDALEATRFQASPAKSAGWADDSDDPLKARVADVLQEVRKEEAVQGIRKYHADRRERLESDLDGLEEWLELEPYQVDEMRVALSTHYDREDEQMRLWEEGESDQALGQVKATDGERFFEDLGAFLQPEQLETFWTYLSQGGK